MPPVPPLFFTACFPLARALVVGYGKLLLAFNVALQLLAALFEVFVVLLYLHEPPQL